MSVRDRWKLKLQRMNKWISRLAFDYLARSLLTKRATCRAHDWKMKSRPGYIFCGCLVGKVNPWNFLFGKKLYFALPCLYPHYIYLHYPQIVRNAFQREIPRKYTWELEIVIPTIIYTFPYGFPQLLPLHLYILERLVSQTLTTLILSVKWDFDAIGKHWKEPFIGRWNRAELRDPKS